MTGLVAAVVVTHNSAPQIAACIRSLQAAGVSEIVIVNNASTDATASVVSSLAVHYISNATNRGFAAANNQGVALTTGPYILLLNPDAQLSPDALDQALAYFQNNQKLAALGLQLVSPSGQPELFSWGGPVTLWSLFTRKAQAASVKPLQVCGWVSAGAVVVRRTAWLAVQGFDPHFFMYWEDVDLCYRLQQKGWQVAHLATAEVKHERGASLGDQKRKTRLYDQSADRYFRKHYATPIWLLQRLLRQLYRWWSPVVS